MTTVHKTFFINNIWDNYWQSESITIYSTSEEFTLGYGVTTTAGIATIAATLAGAVEWIEIERVLAGLGRTLLPVMPLRTKSL